MYSYHTGEVKNPGFELMLILVRVFIFAFIVIVAGGAGMAAGLPAFVSGSLAGLFVIVFFASRPLFELVDHTCPHCGNKIKSLRNFGSYRCSNCGGESVVE